MLQDRELENVDMMTTYFMQKDKEKSIFLTLLRVSMNEPRHQHDIHPIFVAKR